MTIRNAVILIEEVDAHVAQGTPATEAVIAAVRHRARPIALTACAAILGMVPIAPQVFWGPMAYAVIGGLAAATALTLTLLPACSCACCAGRHALPKPPRAVRRSMPLRRPPSERRP